MSVNVRPAMLDDLPELGALFNGYRQFYQQPADLTLATNYIAERMQRGESTILVAEQLDGTLVGFTQLYATFCSVAAAPIFVLYDLFVAPDQRNHGIGRALMNAARLFAESTDAVRMELATGISNQPGQHLYESLNWERDTDFYHYSLQLNR